MNNTTLAVEKILSDQGKTAAGLPLRSRRAYQWTKFLSVEKNLQNHLDALQRVLLYLPGMPRISRLNQYQVEFSLYHIGPLYKIHELEKTIEITAQESFLLASDQVLMALLGIALNPSSGENRQIVRKYASSFQYQTIRESLEYLSIPPGSFSVGKYFDLTESYARVNQKYFSGKLKKPHLVWNNRLTRRKFGHYQEDINTVMVSISLDQARVPEYVVDYVMYHELLHLQLGANLVNDRRYTHTPEFKKKEQDYLRIKDAQKFLNRLSR
ncbi:MAG: hypothetical protein MUO54_04065 [Anaerolineales bacterium]|nr:hypothetical protein [Anaerolineales bacterium]